MWSHSSAVLALVAAATFELSSATPSAKATKQCVDLLVPVSVTANNGKFPVARFEDNVGATDFLDTAFSWTSLNASSVPPVLVVRDTFNISAQLCVPAARGAKSDILQIATHGLGFDKRYWDGELDRARYSYVDYVVGRGYSILTYDRVGNGRSSRPDAYDVGQAPLQVEVLRGLTLMARAGTLISGALGKPACGPALAGYRAARVVHVGHSYGSIVSSGLLSAYGNLSDGALITGFLYNSQFSKVLPPSFGLEYAAQHDRRRFGDRGSGYMVQASESNIQQIFFKKGSFDYAALKYAESVKQTITAGEQLSPGLVLGRPAPAFRGPLQFILGEFDYGICAGDCKGTYDPNVLAALYPAAADRSVYLQPGTGHGLTLSTNATAGYAVMMDYLAAHGL